MVDGGWWMVDGVTIEKIHEFSLRDYVGKQT